MSEIEMSQGVFSFVSIQHRHQLPLISTSVPHSLRLRRLKKRENTRSGQNHAVQTTRPNLNAAPNDCVIGCDGSPELTNPSAAINPNNTWNAIHLPPLGLFQNVCISEVQPWWFRKLHSHSQVTPGCSDELGCYSVPFGRIYFTFHVYIYKPTCYALTMLGTTCCSCCSWGFVSSLKVYKHYLINHSLI